MKKLVSLLLALALLLGMMSFAAADENFSSFSFWPTTRI